MEFDPLSLFTPSPSVESEVESGTESVRYKYSENVQEIIPDEDSLHPLHILDLPLLQLSPPYQVLSVILKLFQPNEVTNFIQEHEEQKDVDTILKQKNITLDELDIALPWLESYCPRFNTLHKLSSIPYLAQSFKLHNDYNSYFTRLISSKLPYSDAQIAFIQKEAALRISENCGRTAHPEIIRKIKLDHFNPVIYLKEPSLTNDNLGLKTWGSSLVLSNRLIRAPKRYLKDTILELGSGTGLTGIVMSKLGYTVTMTDLKQIVPNLKQNCSLNNVDSLVDELDWSNPTTFHNVKFDTIVLSDPIYSSKHPYWVVDMIKLFSKPTTHILIQIPVRPKFEAEREILWNLLSRENIVQIEEEIESGFDDFGKMKFIFKFYKREK